MRELSAIKHVVNKSRFHAHLYEIGSEEDVAIILKAHRRKYKKANHHCYAVLLDGKETSKDDGEVGHPGKVLLEILKKEELTSHCIMVSRIFGGIKLGVGGVSRAFRQAGEACVGERD